MDVQVRAPGNIGNCATDVGTIFEDGLPGCNVVQGYFVTNRHILRGAEQKTRIVGGDNTEHVRAGNQTFHNDNAAGILGIMDQKMGDQSAAPLLNMSCIRHKSR